ncbi:MAG: Rne/Rng family ribonuclease [Acidothermus sp.]|nr:Rne/Rng family ribonuclease [Acidothermus sp.]
MPDNESTEGVEFPDAPRRSRSVRSAATSAVFVSPGAPPQQESAGSEQARQPAVASPASAEVTAPVVTGRPMSPPPMVIFQPPPPPVASRSAEEDASPAQSRRRRRRDGADERPPSGSETESRPAAAEGSQPAAPLPPPVAEEADDRDQSEEESDGATAGTRRRRRRRRRSSGGGEDERLLGSEDLVTEPAEQGDVERSDDVEAAMALITGSTRLEAKRQRRREGREMLRRNRRGMILTEAEFLARRESVERVMVVRQRGDLTQIGVLEDGILVEHYVSTTSANRIVGNVYLGRVQNVLPGMEAAFVDIGKQRNAVLYAGEVNFDLTGLEGQPPRIEAALKPGQPVVVQVTKDPIGHKGARLTSQISLPGRFLVFVPEGSMMGISRKLPDTERNRLKAILRKIMPEGSGVIVRTAAEGATEEELARDIARLMAQWEDIQKKAESATPPALLYAEPDLTIRVVRDIFNEDFSQLVVQGDTEWDMVEAYVAHVAPDLLPRISHWTSEEDVFTHYRIDEQLAKALDRRVWLPSGGYLIIDRTEAMVVIDVNTGRFVGKGGNLEETVTRTNIEAAEEIVRQLRLRDIGGIIVIDFIDMLLEANRELVLRRLVECLGRDRTKHQVAEVTSLGLVQMTRKRVGSGLLEAFSEPCEHCGGRGVIIHTDPVTANRRPAGRSGRGRAKTAAATSSSEGHPPSGDGSASAGEGHPPSGEGHAAGGEGKPSGEGHSAAEASSADRGVES